MYYNNVVQLVLQASKVQVRSLRTRTYSQTMAKLNPDELTRAQKRMRDEARKRVIERGLLQFRADPEIMKAVLEAADARKIPVGSLLRQWVQERLTQENAMQKAPDLVQRVKQLEDTVTKLQQKLR